MPNITSNYLTIDVEEYFQVAAFADIVSPTDWHTFSSRVELGTKKILKLLDHHHVKATFFIVGWTAERHPDLVRQIQKKGHDIGCHSYLHQLIYDMTPEEFREDSKRAKEILEEITGKPVTAYRAPSYSITQKSLWAIPILNELGFLIDSSIFPITHDNYGIPNAPRFPYTHESFKIREYPITTARILTKNIPISGGGYFRLFPYWLTRFFLKRINQQEKQPFTFYLHPWEVDPDQPHLDKASRLSKFRHYNNLDKTLTRFKQLLKDFDFHPLPVT